MSGKAPRRPAKDKQREHREELLDEALGDSFPASDPPAITTPHSPREEEG